MQYKEYGYAANAPTIYSFVSNELREAVRGTDLTQVDVQVRPFEKINGEAQMSHKRIVSATATATKKSKVSDV